MAYKKKIDIRRVEVDPFDLKFDQENPRFGLSLAEDQEAALQKLVEEANLRELWDSIRTQGFVEFEPLVAIPDRREKGKYIVIEGNRRLAAIQTLLEPKRIANLSRKTVPPIDDDMKSSMAKVWVNVVADRRDADAYIGFKHVNGPASWGSVPKAKFAVDMFFRELSRGASADVALSSVTDSLGDDSSTMLRMLVGYQVLEQAMSLGYIPRSLAETRLDFSHLYTMMPNPATRSFLGFPDGPLRAGLVKANPVPPHSEENLKYLVGWLFGGEGIPRVIASQGTDRPKLQKVLAAKSAVDTLISTGDFEKASTEAGLNVESWRSNLIRTETSASNLLAKLPEVQHHMSASEVNDSIERALKARSSFNTLARSLEPADED